MVCDNVNPLVYGCLDDSQFGFLLTTVIEKDRNLVSISNIYIKSYRYEYRLGPFGGFAQITIMAEMAMGEN